MVTPSYAPVIGGTETCVRELGRAMRADGHIVDVLTTNMDVKWRPRWSTVASREEGGGHVLRWGACNPVASIRTAALNRLVGRDVDSFLVGRLQRLTMIHLMLRAGARRVTRQYEIVHCHDEADLTFPVAFRPDVMHLHTMSETFPLYCRAALARHLLRRSGRTWVANSQDSARRAAGLGIPKDRLAVVPNGVDTSVFTPGPEVAGPTDLLFVGRLVPRKGLDVLLGALRYVTTPVNLRVVGGTTDGRYAGTLLGAAGAVERSSPHRVHFLGPCAGPELLEQYRIAGVFVCPSLLEPFGIVALEAMSCQVPVIASKVDGLADVVEHDVTGLLFHPGNEQDLAAQLERLMNDEALRWRLGRAGREAAASRFTWQRAAEQLYQVYRVARLT
jgi:glycosyltransferase involved in cell wall biosynthesis